MNREIIDKISKGLLILGGSLSVFYAVYVVTDYFLERQKQGSSVNKGLEKILITEDRDKDGKEDLFISYTLNPLDHSEILECTEMRYVDSDFDGKNDLIQICTYDHCDKSRWTECLYDYGFMNVMITSPNFGKIKTSWMRL